MSDPGAREMDKGKSGTSLRRFQSFLDEHGSSVYRFVLKFVRNDQDAEDLTQEALLRLHQAMDKLDGRDESLLAWTFRVAMNLVIDFRRRKRAVVTEGDVMDQAFASGSPAPEAVYHRRMQVDLVAEAIDELPDAFREVLVLRYQSGLSYEAMAKVLDVPMTTVETRLFRAKKTLRGVLARKGIHSPAG